MILEVNLAALSLYRTLNFINHSVFSKECTECGEMYIYDGNNDGILNMGKFLIGHDVLRDYMYHFALGGR